MNNEPARAGVLQALDMAHELRSPLGGIESMISMLGEARSQADQEALIAGLKSAAAHLRNVANAMLKPDAATMTDVAVADALRTFVTSASARARAAGLAFRQEISPQCGSAIIADGMALRQMLENLADNAIRHGGGEMVLRVLPQTDEAGREMIEFAVLDGGKGFAPAAGGPGGGIGLTMVERLASRHGGQYGAAARRDRPGAYVWFTLPVMRHRAAQQPLATPAGAPDAPALVVDDDPMSLVLMKTVLGHLGLDCETASSPAEAMALMQGRSFSAIFTDMTMPGTDGWSFIADLRAQGVQTPIVAVSDRVLPEEKRRALDAGAHWVVEKPVTIHDLRQALNVIGLRDPMVRQVSAA